MPDPPKYRHFKPKNLAVVRINGHDHYLGKYDSPESWEKYHRLLAEHMARGNVGPAPKQGDKVAASDLTVYELIQAYWRHVEKFYVKGGRPTTEVCVVYQALGVVGGLYGHSLAREFGPLALEACQEAMVARGWSRKSINRQTIRIRKMWKWAASRQILPGSIYQDLRAVGGLERGRETPGGRVPKERPRVKPVPDDVLEKTLAHLPAIPAAMVRLQRLSGARPHEVCELRPIDLDMSDTSCWVYRPGRHKSEHHGQERIVFLGPLAIAVLRPFLVLDMSAYLFSPRRSEAERNAGRRAERKTPLYRSHVAHQAEKEGARGRRPLGDHYSVGTYRQAIHRGCDRAFPHPELSKIAAKDLAPEQRAKLEAWRKAHRWNPHMIRHATATAIRSRYGLEGSRVVLGESDGDTAAIYADRDEQFAREIMKAIG
jgi:integrase